MSKPKGVQEGAQFVMRHAGQALVVVMALSVTGGRPLARTFRPGREEELCEFIEPLNGKRNLYYSANPVRRALNKKPTKDDMASMSYAYVDIDPRAGQDRERERKRIRGLLSKLTPRPTSVVDSGNGYNVLWQLEEPLANDGDYDRLEALNKHLALRLSGDNCHNIDRILRIPGTVNLPTKRKAELGYTEVVSQLLWQEDRTVRQRDFELLPDRFVELLDQDKKLKARWMGDAAGLSKDSRSEFDMSVVGMLKVRGFSREETESVLRLFPFGQYAATRDERAFERCWKRAAEGVTAQPATEDVVEALNREFAVVLTGGRLSVLWEHVDASGQPKVDLLSLDAFKGWLANRTVMVPTDKGVTTKPLANHWISHPARRQYREIAFSPGKVLQGVYNLWKGFSVEPRKGDWSLLRAHLFDNVCQGNEKLFSQFFGWWADLFKNPGNKSGTAMVLRGKQGVGKSIVGELFGALIGRDHYRPVANQRFVSGRFNSHMLGCLLLHADEAFWAGDKEAEGSLKSLVTAPRIPVEFKGKETFWVDNHVRVFITSNFRWAVPAGLEERRFITLDVGDARMQDRTYFRRIVEQFEDGGAEALMYDLLAFDLSSIDLGEIPKTAALRDQKAESLPIEEQWLLDLLMRGQLPGDDAGEGHSPAKLLYDHFIRTTNQVGAKRRPFEMTISRMLYEWLPDIDKREGTYMDRVGRYERAERRGRIWLFPSLQECREAFDRKSGERWPWDEPRDWMLCEGRRCLLGLRHLRVLDTPEHGAVRRPAINQGE